MMTRRLMTRRLGKKVAAKRKVRLSEIDIFRGVPLFLMIIFHFANELWSGSMYADAPYYSSLIDGSWLVHMIPALFAFISGISIFLLFASLQEKGRSGLVGIVKRYGIYVLFSLPFTWFLFGLDVFMRWDETIQGIGMTGILLACYLFFSYRWHWRWHVTSLLVALGLHGLLLVAVRPLAAVYPLSPLDASSFGTAAVSLLLNIVNRGFFSLSHLIVYMIGGVIFMHLWKKPVRSSLLTGSALVLIAVGMHLLGVPIQYYMKSVSYQLLCLGEVILIGTAVRYCFVRRIGVGVLNTLYVFGRVTIVSYLGHFILLIKPIQALGLGGHLNQLFSWLLAAVLLTIVYFGSKYYMSKRGIPLQVIS